MPNSQTLNAGDTLRAADGSCRTTDAASGGVFVDLFIAVETSAAAVHSEVETDSKGC